MVAWVATEKMSACGKHQVVTPVCMLSAAAAVTESSVPILLLSGPLNEMQRAPENADTLACAYFPNSESVCH